MGSEIFEFYANRTLEFTDIADVVARFFSVSREGVVDEAQMWSDENIRISPRVGVRLDDIGGSFRTTVLIQTDFYIEAWRYRPFFSYVAMSIGDDVLADDMGRYAEHPEGQFLLHRPDGSIKKVRETSGTDNYEVDVIGSV